MSDRKPILVLSNIIVDDVYLADGSHQGLMLGGAAVWAAIGARIWHSEVGIVAGVGADLETVSAGQLREFGLRPEGELVRAAKTILSTLAYREDGERSETPAFGPDHFETMQVTPGEIPAALLPAAGSYVFRDLWPEFWRAYHERRNQLGTVLWELQGNLAEPRSWPHVRDILPDVDLFSLNRSEAQGLIGVDEPDAVADTLLAAGAPVVILRMGAEGALIATAGERLRVRPPVSPVVDVTGGGNSFCGGFLAGWCQKPGDLNHAARCAAASAALCIAQYGLPHPDRLGDAKALAAAAETEARPVMTMEI